MYRRDLLTATSATVVGAALLTAGARHATAGNTISTGRARRLPGSLIETRDGTQLFYRDWGTGKPILFLSGWSLASDIWAYQMSPLSEAGYRCIAFDRRGHGRSSDPGTGYDYDSLADDLDDVLTAMDLKDLTVVAHSIAGGEVVRYVSRHGAKRIKRVLLLSTTLPCLTKSADNPDGIESTAFEQGRRGLLAQGFPSLIGEKLRPVFALPDTPTATLDWVHNMMMRTSIKAVLDCNKAFTATDFRAELPKLTMPVLIVHGDRDISAPPALTSSKVARLLPRAEIKMYEGGPHGLMLTHTQQLNRDLLAFAE